MEETASSAAPTLAVHAVNFSARSPSTSRTDLNSPANASFIAFMLAYSSWGDGGYEGVDSGGESWGGGGV